MKPVIKEKHFVVAYNLLNPKKSKILSNNVDYFSLDVFLNTDANDFVGRGFEIYGCTLAEISCGESEVLIELDFEGKQTIFEVKDYIFSFPVIEGNLIPGIYQEYNDGSFDFFEITDVLSLTKFINHTHEVEFAKNKYLCNSEEITFTNFEETKPQYFFPGFPLTYFDVRCPFCHQKVITYQTMRENNCTDPADGLRCSLAKLPCSHFVGLAVLEGASYERAALDNLRRNYKYENNE